jgi:hypothetical protein
VQAVIRLSKKYLPGMAISYKHPKDGFKFLADYKDTFDVIITDSSDPEGPAESLFQKPYFELLHGALKEGGIITTQGKKSQLLGSLEMLLHHFLPYFKSFTSNYLHFYATYANSTLRREHLAPSPTDHAAQERLQGGLPERRICLHDHSYLPIRPDRLHGLQQGCEAEPQEAPALLFTRGGKQALQILQQRDPRGILRSADLRSRST